MLTDAAIRSAKPKGKPYRLADGHGLYIEVRPAGSKLWRFRYRINGKENVFAMGKYPSGPVADNEPEADRCARLELGIRTLLEARAELLKARALVKKGIHPAHHRNSPSPHAAWNPATSLANVARNWIAENGKDWSEKYRYNVEICLSRDVFPHLGKMPVAAVKPVHILDLVNRIQARSPITAKLAKMWLGAIFRFAALKLLVEDDPTRPLKGLIKLPRSEHHRTLEIRRIGEFLRTIDGDRAPPSTRAACQLLWLTLVRTHELRHATWDEFDLKAGMWRIPAMRMKAREDHVVPLCRQAVAILESMQTISDQPSHVFPSQHRPRQALGYAAIRNLFLRVNRQLAFGAAFTAHGVRSTFSTLANDAGVRADLIEKCLAHQERNASRRAYNRSTLLPERRELMRRWADLLDDLRAGKPVDIDILRGNRDRIELAA